jgi:hypothetical protein
MAKAKRMTLKQAAELLKTTDYPYGLPAIQKAAIAGKLKAQLKTDAPIPYYLVAEADLLAWAADPEQHKPGRKSQ